jgi:hypothetical protein
VRRIVFAAMGSVFASLPPLTLPPSGAQVLDLSRTPVEIVQPGVYVLNRNWDALFNVSPNSAIHITADDVTLDMQGFDLLVIEGGGIYSTGTNGTIRNGSVRTRTGIAIQVGGRGTRIENMRVRADSGGAVSLMGVGSVLSDSEVTGNVNAGSGTLVRDNSIFSQRTALSMWSSRATVVGNDVDGCAIGPCITVEGDHNVVERNRILMVDNDVRKYGLIVVGDHNLALGNIFGRCSGSTAILVTGLGNIFRDNLAPRSEPQELGGIPPKVCGTGIEFQRDGNFYGDNTMWATVPFNVGASVQTDLGGNVGLNH